MSHFTTLVITQNGTEGEAKELLSPFDENRVMEEYSKPCWCIGMVAKKRIRLQLETEMPIEAARNTFNAREDVKRLIQESLDAENYGFSEEVDKLWHESFLTPYNHREQELLAMDAQVATASPDCSDCNGTGIEVTTYNPKSKWDWKSLGGRWEEIYAPIQGKTIAEFAQFKDADGDPHRTFAVVTPDGQWHEKGKMLFFAVVADETPRDAWAAEYDEILAKYADYKALIYDCHI
jgi:hypothetical protein